MINLEQYSEFYGLGKIDTCNKIKFGKRILETTFGTQIKVFVSPQEFLTKSLLICLKNNNLCYCGGIGKNLIMQLPFGHLRARNLVNVVIKKFGDRSFRYDKYSTLNLENITSTTIISPTFRHYWNKFKNEKSAEYWLDDFKKSFDNKRMENGYFILLTHNFEYFYDWQDRVTQQNQYKYFYKIINYINSQHNVWKCSLNELTKWRETLDGIKVRKGYKEIKISSPVDIRGLTIISNKIKMSSIKPNYFIARARDDSDMIILDIKSNQIVKLQIK